MAWDWALQLGLSFYVNCCTWKESSKICCLPCTGDRALWFVQRLDYVTEEQQEQCPCILLTPRSCSRSGFIEIHRDLYTLLIFVNNRVDFLKVQPTNFNLLPLLKSTISCKSHLSRMRPECFFHQCIWAESTLHLQAVPL